MKQIFFDTNALMAIAQFKIDLFTELEKACDFRYKIIILSGTIAELKKIIKEQRGKYKAAAKLALALIKAKNISILKSEGNVDDFLAEYSQKGSLVLTQDIQLKKRLTRPYLTIRQKRKVILIS